MIIPSTVSQADLRKYKAFLIARFTPGSQSDPDYRTAIAQLITQLEALIAST